MALYGSYLQGGVVVCGCACGTGRYGDKLIVDFSGIQVCPCVETDPPSSLTVAQNVTMPTMWECNAVNEVAWESEIAGVFDIFGGSECGDLSELFADCTFKVRVSCFGSEFLVEMLTNAAIAPAPRNAFTGVTDGGIGGEASNIIPCQIYAGADPYAYFSGGVATVSIP